MWYVIQTYSGNEHVVMKLFEEVADRARYNKCFVPMFEDVRKKDGKGQIVLKKFFPGYIFIETESPAYINEILREIPDFTRVLGTQGGGSGREGFYPHRRR